MATAKNVHGHGRRGRLDLVRDLFKELIDELLIWLAETREDSFCPDICNFSFQAAEYAALLGFDRPPCELIPLVAEQEYLKLADTRLQAIFTRVRIHPPFGWSTFDFGFTQPLSESLLSGCNPRLQADLIAWAKCWKRSAERLDCRACAPAKSTFILSNSSHEALIFNEQRERALAGDTASFFEEMRERMTGVLGFAELNGLTREQANSLCSQEGCRLYLESYYRRKTLSDLGLQNDAQVDAVKKSNSGPSGTEKESRKDLTLRAESHVKENCGGVFPGFRELARALGCEKRLGSLANAIKSSKYLSARKAQFDKLRQGQPREHPLTEAHLDQVSQSTEPDPAEMLERLIQDQEADLRNDDRMAKSLSRSRSR